MDYENVYYVDNRNAAPVVVDHRTGARLPSRTPNVLHAIPASSMPGGWQSPYAAFGPQGWYPVNPGYISPPQLAPSNNLTSILGGFGDIGSLSNIIAQAFAAFMPLPAAPTPQDAADSDPSTNAATNSSNLIRYQNALALYAKRDQQILTLGSILKELFKRPGSVIG